jgi:hypothetical protein
VSGIRKGQREQNASIIWGVAAVGIIAVVFLGALGLVAGVMPEPVRRR